MTLIARLSFSPKGALIAKRQPLVLGIAISSISAFAISYSTAWAIRVNSSTTYSIVGALNKLPVALSGMIFLPSENVTLGNVCSVILAFLAGLVYSWSQVAQKREHMRTVLPISEKKLLHP